jgi:L-aspartate oxidase
MTVRNRADVIIIGSGIAALIAADRLADEKNVIVITKSEKEHSNSIWAQGGVAAAISNVDSWKDHYRDTMVAGCFHNDETAVKLLVQKGSSRLQELMSKGLKFDQDKNGRLHLGKEGAHRKRRILHSGGDSTGKAIITFLLERVLRKVKIIENELAIDLLIEDGRCIGVRTKSQDGMVNDMYASHTVLASGGCGKLFPFTSNHPSVTGDGIAMAYRAGAELADLEFMQFHPTMLYVNGEARGLISEAVRGEGAILITGEGDSVMQGVHPQEDLAPRDVVARQIHQTIHAGTQVFLDISMITGFTERFPTITTLCKQNEIDVSKGRIPVVPGAHFLMGGVRTNQYGQTNIKNLFAVGEVACTGVHGANRLASNSLLEGIVFANEMSEFILDCVDEDQFYVKGDKHSRFMINVDLPIEAEIQEIMMRYVAIVRTEEGLQKAKQWLEKFVFPFLQHANFQPSSANLTFHELKIVNMLTTAWLITTSALQRTESRGGHYRQDFPYEAEYWSKKTITRSNEELIGVDHMLQYR